MEDKGGGDRGNLWGERAGWREGENLRILRDIGGGREERERERESESDRNTTNGRRG